MAYITEYYLDLKIIDKTSPVKRRVEFFRRSTNEHLLTIPAANVPADGVIVTTALNKDIPAKDIYAIAFDDVGNRQLAGADKLSIKSREIWVEQELLFHIEYVPGETYNDRVSTATLVMSSNKSIEYEFVNGTLTTFNTTTPMITEKGLCHHPIYYNYMTNTYVNNSMTNITFSTYKSIRLCSIRETAETGEHSCNNLFSEVTQIVDAYSNINLHFIKYIKPFNVTNFNYKVYQQDKVTLLLELNIDLTNKTITKVSGGTFLGEIYIDNRFPDYYVLNFLLNIAANITIGKETITFKNNNNISYLGNVNNGLDIWTVGLNSFMNTQAANQSLINYHPLEVTNIAKSVNNCNFSYTGLSTNLKNHFSSTNPTMNLMLDLNIQLFFEPNILNYSSSFQPLIGYNLNYLVAWSPTSKKFCIGYIYNEKDIQLIDLPNFNKGDEIRIRMLGATYDKLPSSIKTAYSVGENLGFCKFILENLTKGTKTIVTSANDKAYKKMPSLIQSENLILTPYDSANIKLPYYIKRLKMWDQPLPGDWDTWI